VKISRPVLRYHGKRSFREPGDISRFNLTRYRVDEEAGCHLWNGALSDSGYAVVGTNRDGTFRVSRLVFIRDKGPLAPGLMPDHKCRNRACINSAHLEAVTNAENARRGAKAKLTQEKADEIRRLYAAGGTSYRDLAAKFRVSSCAISNIMNRKRWA